MVASDCSPSANFHPGSNGCCTPMFSQPQARDPVAPRKDHPRRSHQRLSPTPGRGTWLESGAGNLFPPFEDDSGSDFCDSSSSSSDGADEAEEFEDDDAFNHHRGSSGHDGSLHEGVGHASYARHALGAMSPTFLSVHHSPGAHQSPTFSEGSHGSPSFRIPGFSPLRGPGKRRSLSQRAFKVASPHQADPRAPQPKRELQALRQQVAGLQHSWHCMRRERKQQERQIISQQQQISQQQRQIQELQQSLQALGQMMLKHGGPMEVPPLLALSPKPSSAGASPQAHSAPTSPVRCSSRASRRSMGHSPYNFAPQLGTAADSFARLQALFHSSSYMSPNVMQLHVSVPYQSLPVHHSHNKTQDGSNDSSSRPSESLSPEGSFCNHDPVIRIPTFQKGVSLSPSPPVPTIDIPTLEEVLGFGASSA